LRVDTKISSIEELKSSVSGGIKCEHCGIELMNAAGTNPESLNLKYRFQLKQVNILMGELQRVEELSCQVKERV